MYCGVDNGRLCLFGQGALLRVDGTAGGGDEDAQRQAHLEEVKMALLAAEALVKEKDRTYTIAKQMQLQMSCRLGAIPPPEDDDNNDDKDGGTVMMSFSKSDQQQRLKEKCVGWEKKRNSGKLTVSFASLASSFAEDHSSSSSAIYGEEEEEEAVIEYC
jgi:hypothetical protein